MSFNDSYNRRGDDDYAPEAEDPRKCKHCQDRTVLNDRGYCSDYCERDAQDASEPGSLFDSRFEAEDDEDDYYAEDEEEENS